MKWEERADIALSWFKHEKTPANLVMMYVEEPDAHGHVFGPKSPVVNPLRFKLCSYFHIKLSSSYIHTITLYVLNHTDIVNYYYQIDIVNCYFKNMNFFN